MSQKLQNLQTKLEEVNKLLKDAPGAGYYVLGLRETKRALERNIEYQKKFEEKYS